MNDGSYKNVVDSVESEGEFQEKQLQVLEHEQMVESHRREHFDLSNLISHSLLVDATSILKAAGSTCVLVPQGNLKDRINPARDNDNIEDDAT